MVLKSNGGRGRATERRDDGERGVGGEGKIKILVVTFDRIILTQAKLRIQITKK